MGLNMSDKCDRIVHALPDDVDAPVSMAHAEHGFGFLMEIGVTMILSSKFGAVVDAYRSLRACHRGMTHKVIQIEAG